MENPVTQLITTRLEQALTQAQVAERLGTTQELIEQWERGERSPSPYFCRKLCQLFGKNAEELGLSRAMSNPFPEPSSTQWEQRAPATTAPVVTHKSLPVYDPAIPALTCSPVGRGHDLASLKLRLFERGYANVTALNGLPGVGKTTLSIALAHDQEVCGYFRDGILWAGLGPNPNVLALLSRWGALLEISPTETASLSDVRFWARAIHNAIGTRCMLLVIDDVWNIEEALAFKVGGPNCSHLLTTRHSEIASFVASHGAQKIDALNDEVGLELLHQLAPDVVACERQKAQDLVRAVGGLPLALTLIGNYLRKQTGGRSHHITAALERLSSAEERLQIQEPNSPNQVYPGLTNDIQLSLQSVIAVTDQHLAAPTRSALYALSVFPAKPNSFSEEVAIIVADCDSGILDMLVDMGILENSGINRYALHQTIRDYAYLQLQHSSVHDVVQRRLVASIIAFLDEHNSDFELLELESSTILTALEQAHNLSMYAELVSATITFTPYLQLRGLYTQADLHLRHAQEAVLTFDNPQILSTLLLYHGQVLQHQGKWPQAADVFQKGLALAHAHDNPEQISAFLNDLGWVTWKLGNYVQAEVYLREGLEIARKIHDQKRIGSILKELGVVVSSRGNYTQAESYLQESLAIAHRLGRLEQLAIDVLVNLGFLAGRQGSHEQAAHYFSEGLKIARQSRHQERICALTTNLGAALMELGAYGEAETYFHEGLEVAHYLHLSQWQAILLVNLGEIALAQKNYFLAESDLQEALVIARLLGSPQITAKVLYELGNAQLHLLKVEQAQAAFEEMRPIIPQDDPELQALASFGEARIAALHGDIGRARYLGEQSAKELKAIGHGNTQVVYTWLDQLGDG